MGNAKNLTEAQELGGEFQHARVQLNKAENKLLAAKEQSRIAKRKRKEAKEEARRAKKEVKRAKSEMAEARKALTDISARLAQAGLTDEPKPPRTSRPKRKRQASGPVLSDQAGSPMPETSGRSTNPVPEPTPEGSISAPSTSTQ
jgi:hypothetical protein